VLSGFFVSSAPVFSQTCTVTRATGETYAGVCRSSTETCPSGQFGFINGTSGCSFATDMCCAAPSSGGFSCGTSSEKGQCKSECGSDTPLPQYDYGSSQNTEKCPSSSMSKCCKGTPSTTSCTGKDTSGATQTGTCSTTADCSSGTKLDTLCAGGMACCYTASSGGKCTDTAGQKCSADCSKETGYVAGGTGTCDSATPNCCKSSTTTTTPASATCSGSNPGLIPCGRSCDNPATPENETDICTLCHLFLLMRNITSWIFMVMTYIAFAVLVAMGILYIVSAGNTQMITLAKGGIKAALYGFAIVLLGWVAINVILMVLADGALGTDTATFSFKTNGSWFTYSCNSKSKYVRTGIGGATTPAGTAASCDKTKCAATCPAGQTASGANSTACTSQCTTSGQNLYCEACGDASNCKASTDCTTGTDTACASVCTDSSKPYCKPAQNTGGGGPIAGGGTCTVITAAGNPCSVESLKATCFGAKGDAVVNAMSQICNVESTGGNPSADSTTDHCGQGGPTVSGGLFQINVTTSAGAECNGCANPPLRSVSAHGCNASSCWYDENCKVIDAGKVSSCMQKAHDPGWNTTRACYLYDTGGGYKPWSMTAHKCGLM